MVIIDKDYFTAQVHEHRPHLDLQMATFIQQCKLLVKCGHIYTTRQIAIENCCFLAAISLGISDLLQHGHGTVSVTEEEGEEHGSTEEIVEQEDQRPGEGPKVAIPSA